MVALSRRQIGLGAGPRVGRKRISERSGLGLPDPALDAALACEGQIDGSSQAGTKHLVREVGHCASEGSGIHVVAIANEVAGARDDRIGAADPGRRRLLVELHQEYPDRDTGEEGQRPNAQQPGPQAGLLCSHRRRDMGARSASMRRRIGVTLPPVKRCGPSSTSISMNWPLSHRRAALAATDARRAIDHWTLPRAERADARIGRRSDAAATPEAPRPPAVRSRRP
jgi:hypothetical protein